MNILAIADEPCKALWDYYDKSRLEDVDLILSAGDLPGEYLSFLVTFSKGPVLYVHGNHDKRYQHRPPEGCDCVEDRIINYRGVRILGLGGSYCYSGEEHQYTEAEMEKRYRNLKKEIKKNRGFDILLTHAPARGIHDQSDLCHTGFEVFNRILEEQHPSYMVHGHTHLNYGHGRERVTQVGDTTVINAFERYRFTAEPKPEGLLPTTLCGKLALAAGKCLGK